MIIREPIELNDLLSEALNDIHFDNIDELISSLEHEFSNKICIVLQAYGHPRGTVENFEIDKDSLSIDNQSIFFNVEYYNYVYEGCKDRNLEIEENHSVEIKYYNGSLMVIGEDRPERNDEI
ncbi:hypothetical protein [Aquimarina algiphila]|uniref:hypothetical protein n=1 Tax=Aquimarina algiphila TaxID=2047982 RepID=UPI00232D45BD|nr:hypothetical protein [Aquimarina algiphila]